MKLNVGVVGATGIVGEEFLKLIEERNFPLDKLKLFASHESKGKKLSCQGKTWEVQPLNPGCFAGLDLVFFSSGDDISQEWGPQAVSSGAFAIDNSAAFRLSPSTPLIIPEINGDLISSINEPLLIANPNCSTIQLALVLAPLQKEFGLSQIHVASYQAVSGAGKAAREELLNQIGAELENKSLPLPQIFPHPIAFDCLPHIGRFDSQGFTSEEMKIIKESQKILREPELKISAFTVRVPVLNSHSEAVWVTLKQKVSLAQIKESLMSSSALEIMDHPQENIYPRARIASGRNPVFVGRIHQDYQDPFTWLMWIVADNLRVGAALNGIRIAEKIFKTS